MSYKAAPAKDKILFAAEDAGGALALAPVIRKMTAEDHSAIRVVSHGAAHGVWRKKNIDSEPFGFAPTATRSSRANTILEQQPTSVLVTGTSWQGDDVERHLIATARIRSIPTLSVLDFWSNYVERFSGDSPKEKLRYLPDTVAVMDEYAAGEMVKRGVPRHKLCVTGNPHLEDLAKWLEIDKCEAKQQIFKSTGIEVERGMVLFVSQGLESLYGQDLGFSEHEALRDLIDVRRKRKANWEIVVKLHPNEAVQKYATYEATEEVTVLRQEIDPRLLICGADVVIGMRSTLLVESACLQRRVISYQPGLIGHDPMFTNKLGITYAIFSVEELSQAIQEVNRSDSSVWQDVDKAQKDVELVKNATNNVIELIYAKASTA